MVLVCSPMPRQQHLRPHTTTSRTISITVHFAFFGRESLRAAVVVTFVSFVDDAGLVNEENGRKANNEKEKRSGRGNPEREKSQRPNQLTPTYPKYA